MPGNEESISTGDTTTRLCSTRLPPSGAVGISVRQFEQLKERVTRPRRKSAATPIPHRIDVVSTSTLILGIDPSLRGTGYGVIQINRRSPLALDYGTISCPAGWARSRCLAQIARVLRDVIHRHRPEVCAIEGLFYAQNLQTALILGEARGVALLTAAEAGMEIFEIAPRKVKQAIVGYGAARKEAVARMVQRMLCLAEPPASDAADALALALAHAQEGGRSSVASARKL